VLRAHATLATGAVFAEADRQGLGRSAGELAELRSAVRNAAGEALLPAPLAVNDLEPAAVALCPEVGDALAQARRARADQVLVCGSGPTVVGLYAAPQGARAAATMLAHRDPAPIAATPWRVREQVAT
jgi:4-diphosphocytidyl-2-C-methyl-D-erythritol kinase